MDQNFICFMEHKYQSKRTVQQTVNTLGKLFKRGILTQRDFDTQESIYQVTRNILFTNKTTNFILPVNRINKKIKDQKVQNGEYIVNMASSTMYKITRYINQYCVFLGKNYTLLQELQKMISKRTRNRDEAKVIQQLLDPVDTLRVYHSVLDFLKTEEKKLNEELKRKDLKENIENDLFLFWCTSLRFTHRPYDISFLANLVLVQKDLSDKEKTSKTGYLIHDEKTTAISYIIYDKRKEDYRRVNDTLPDNLHTWFVKYMNVKLLSPNNNIANGTNLAKQLFQYLQKDSIPPRFTPKSSFEFSTKVLVLAAQTIKNNGVLAVDDFVRRADLVQGIAMTTNQTSLYYIGLDQLRRNRAALLMINYLIFLTEKLKKE